MATGFRNLNIYIPREIFDNFYYRSEEIGLLINCMIQNSEKYK